MSEKLELALSNYRVVSSITNKAKTLTLSNKKYISEFKLPLPGKKSTNDINEINKYFDSLNDTILEHSYLELFASFEAILIKKIKLASGEMTKNIEDNYYNLLPFVSYGDRFVKNIDDFSSLNKILNLLENKISKSLFLKFKTLVKYRDRLAHGKSFHEGVVLDSIEDTHKIMAQILEEIG